MQGPGNDGHGPSITTFPVGCASDAFGEGIYSVAREADAYGSAHLLRINNIQAE